MTRIPHTLCAAVLVLTVANGCDTKASSPEASGMPDDDPAEPDSAEGGTDSQPEPDDAGGQLPDDEDEVEPEPFDLFSCEWDLSCPPFVIHSSSGGDQECAATLAASGQTGVLSYLLTPGPYIDEVQTLSLLLGDGTALVQIRERHCGGWGSGDECEFNFDTLPWEPGTPHMICELFTDEESRLACDPYDDSSCTFFPVGYESCEVVDDYSCEEASAILEGA